MIDARGIRKEVICYLFLLLFPFNNCFVLRTLRLLVLGAFCPGSGEENLWLN
jgi:hypothetical protein